MKPKLSYKEEKRERKGIYASDYGKLNIDILLSLKGVEASNPPEWNDTLKWSAGKAIELQFVKILKENNIVDNDFSQDEQETTEIIRNGVPIRMNFDARVKTGGAKMIFDDSILPQSFELELKEGEPIEIKSINNKNSYDIQKFIDNKPRENYVGQLSIYLDALNQERGHLFVSSIDGLNYFWFECKKIGEKIYKCGDTIVDLNKEYERFADLWNRRNEEPQDKDWNEEIYKIPIENIDWTKLSVSKIGDIRNGRYVVGSENKFKIDYSDYKDLILEKQGVKAGYTEEEIAIIKEKTAGFSSKKK